ncbi:MAG: hypothetical protein MZV63_64860 [Marinilabiliales bacterium]|nr:hypothetical protein [Marinilabiliales bacterium]
MAREARLSKATIYKYVPGKGVLLFEILSHYVRRPPGARSRRIAAGPGTRRREARAGLIAWSSASRESKQSLTRVLWMDKSMLKLMRVFVAAARQGRARPRPRDRKSSPAMLRRSGRRSTTLGARILDRRRGRRASSGRWTPARPSSSSRPCIEGYTHVHFWKGGAPSRPDAADELTRFVIEGIRNPERPAKEN